MLAAYRNRIARQIIDFRSWHVIFATGRAVMAVGQVSILLFTPATALFVPVGGDDPLSSCDRAVLAISPYCWFSGAEQIVNIFILFAFMWIASGFLPQVSGFVHIWLSFSLAQSISLPDGGDYVAQVVAVFLAFISLGHDRLWYWKSNQSQNPSPTIRAAIGVGAVWALRMQISWIYVNSSLAKISVEEWQEGSAIYYIARQEFFGSGGLFGDLFLWLTAIPLLSLVITWGTILVELSIAVLILFPRNAPSAAFLLSLFLHAGIIVIMGLFSFGLIMIGAVLIAAAPSICSTVGDLSAWRNKRNIVEKMN